MPAATSARCARAPCRSRTAATASSGGKIFISGGEHDLTRQHRAPGAVPPARRAGRAQGPVAGAGAQAAARRRAQRGALRAHRGKDGPARQPHLRDALRRRHRLAGRRAEPRPGRDVRDDERGAAARGAAGHRPARRGLAEGRRLRQRAAPDARPRPGAGQPRRRGGRPDRRAPRGAPHPRDAARLDRRRAACWPTAPRCSWTSRGTTPTRRRRERAQRWCALVTPVLKAGLHRSRPSTAPATACRSSAATATCANGASSRSCAMRA